MSTPPGESSGRARRRTRAPSKLIPNDGSFSEAELQRAIRASVKLQRRTSSTAVPACPTFRPSALEFRDPFAYIKSITPEASKAGIAKIIPPDGWRPEFNPDAGGDGIPFETKLQAINRLQEGIHFEDGRRYTRETYEAMADAFAARWRETHPGVEARILELEREALTRKNERLEDAEEGAATAASASRFSSSPDAPSPTELATEEEFWRVAETNVESVKVEYGSDLDADVYGTGFARGRSCEDDPDDSGGVSGSAPAGSTPSSAPHHPWDFNELIAHPSNLLRVVGADIPGLTRPWLYFGMLFSAFCWHVEDHHLGSVNYNHRGATKTWYGIPSASAEAFEAALRTMAPNLVERDPNLLHKLVTLAPPAALRDAHGVEVFQTRQREGEFVVTWPRAYHAGFSHGFNVAEAVNFGTAEWVPTGRAAVNAYATGARGAGKRGAIFSHDRMVLETSRDFARRFLLGSSGQKKKMKTMKTGTPEDTLPHVGPTPSLGPPEDEEDAASSDDETRAERRLNRAPWIAAIAATLRAELATIVEEQEEGRAAALARGIAREAEGAPSHAWEDDSDDDERCAACESMPHLAVVRCVACWKANERREVEAAIARARAEGKSVAGAAFAMLGAGAARRRKRDAALGRDRERRDGERPVFCLRHAADGCEHAGTCKVMRVRAEIEDMRDVMLALDA